MNTLSRTSLNLFRTNTTRRGARNDESRCCLLDSHELVVPVTRYYGLEQSALCSSSYAAGGGAVAIIVAEMVTAVASTRPQWLRMLWCNACTAGFSETMRFSTFLPVVPAIAAALLTSTPHASAAPVPA